jgi:hypothetical protein
MLPLIFLVVFLSCFVTLGNGQEQIVVFKMLQYEKDSVQFGSLRSSFNLIATTVDKLDAELSKFVVLVHLDRFDEPLLSLVWLSSGY